MMGSEESGKGTRLGGRMALDGYTDQTLPRQARAAELLDAETETRLARAWRDNRDEAALHRLITAYMRLAISVAAKFRRYGAPMNDLTQEAALGLMKAAEKFDPDRGVRFSTYAVWWIRASVQDYVLRNWSLVRTGSTAGQKSLFFNLSWLKAKFTREAAAEGRSLSQAQMTAKVAEELRVSQGDVAMMEGRLGGMDMSLNAPQTSDADGREWIDLLEDEAPGAEAQVSKRHDSAQVRAWLGRALGVLSERERFIVAARRLSDEPRTLESLGCELHLSKERIRQLESGAYVKMKRALAGQAGELALFLA
jgi:RNA polymerase sigma-32 factor